VKYKKGGDSDGTICVPLTQSGKLEYNRDRNCVFLSSGCDGICIFTDAGLRKEYSMRKKICFCLALVMLLSSMSMFVGAVDFTGFVTESGELGVVEQKVLSTATTEEEFADNHVLVSNQELIAEAIADEQACELHMAEYVGNHAALSEKLIFVEWDVEELQGVLYGRIDCYLSEELTAEETEKEAEHVSI
jgi:hypothetical protein